MDVIQATTDYEAWAGQRCTLLPEDLELKHERMAESLFPFLRATFYRWMQLWPTACPQLAEAPTVLAVGDLHVDNFGTWRDSEGRLVWGVNDFDEAYPLPYTADLVRLATSALFSIEENGLKLCGEDVCQAILRGYTECLTAGGKPFVLCEHHHWLREVANSQLRDPVHYWKKLDEMEAWDEPLPKKLRQFLVDDLPDRKLKIRIVHRVAGLGHLGKPRYAALAEWRGGRVAREGKALIPSACLWAGGDTKSQKIRYAKIAGRAVRCPDPFLRIQDEWLVRRLAPDCSRIELYQLETRENECRLLESMGWETANIHLGSENKIKDVVADLKRRPAGWLHEAAQKMKKEVSEDWKVWGKMFLKKDERKED